MPERTGVQRLSIRTRYGDMAPDCCTEYSLGKLYLTLLLPPSSPERRGQGPMSAFPPVHPYLSDTPTQTTLLLSGVKSEKGQLPTLLGGGRDRPVPVPVPVQHAMHVYEA